MNSVRDSIEKLYSDRSLSENERSVCGLIVAAIDNSIISSGKELGDGYFSFTLDIGGGKRAEYEVRIGANPSRATHPTAERAIRASEFVDMLISIMDREHNCYVVQSVDVRRPSCDEVKKRVFRNRPVTVTENTSMGGASSYFRAASEYDLQVEIIASIGNAFKRMSDYLSVRIDNNNNVTYSHKPFKCNNYFKGDGIPDGFDIERAQEQIDNICKIVGGDISVAEGAGTDVLLNRNLNNQAMLDAFLRSEDSEFSKFLNEISGKETVTVGQISITPTSVLASAIPEMEFIYDVSENGSEPVQLSLIWSHESGALTADSLLYIVTDADGNFRGLSYNSDEGKRESFEAQDDLVVANKIINGRCEPLGLTFPIDNKNTSYKGVTACAAKVSGSNAYGTDRYYYLSETKIIDGGVYLKAECKKCGLKGEEHWSGKMEKAAIVKRTQGGSAPVFTRNALIFNSGLSMHKCETCGCAIYSLENSTYGRYIASTEMLDGSHYCGACGTTVMRNGIKAKRVDGVIRSSESLERGNLYANVDAKGEYLKPEDGGNVFECANCHETVYFNKNEPYNCEVCGEHLCKLCATSKGGAYSVLGKTVFDTQLHFCSSCPTDEKSAPITKNEANKGKRLFKVADADGTPCTVIDSASEPDRIFNCPVCKKETYFDENEEHYARCGCCNRVLHKKCAEDLPVNKWKMSFCPECEAIRRTPKYRDELMKTEADIVALRKERNDIIRVKRELDEGWPAEVRKDIKRYLPYMSISDIRSVKKAIKTNDPELGIRVVVKNSAINNTGAKLEYSITVNGTSTLYDFVYINGKISYGGKR